MKTKIGITKWIKQTFKNEQDFNEFLQFADTFTLVQCGMRLNSNYVEWYENNKTKYQTILDSIKDLPELEIVERFGKETHYTMRTPLNYMSYFYGTDQKRRIKLFKTA